MIRSTVLLALLFISATGNAQTNKNYIILRYFGDYISKPIPTIVLYRDSFFDKGDTMVYSPIYEVNKCEFLSIKNAIEEIGVSNNMDTAKFVFYNFIIVNNGKQSFYKTVDLEGTEAIFEEILKQIPKNTKYKNIKYFFRHIVGRIKSIYSR